VNLASALSPVTDTKRKYIGITNAVLSGFDLGVSCQLFAVLFQPLDSFLEGIESLTIVSDEPISNLPFEALIMPSRKTGSVGEKKEPRFLLERFAIDYSPSAFRRLQTSKRDRQGCDLVLALGNPASSKQNPYEGGPIDFIGLNSTQSSVFVPLPGSEKEVESISRLFGEGAKCLLREDATKQAFEEYAPSYRVLHIAAHARFDDVRPLNSVIYLASSPGSKTDATLRAFDLLNLDLNADLVVLSCCGSAGKWGLAGCEGFVQGFFFAGVPSVVAALWNVDDLAAATLMEAFYRHLKEGKGKAQALRAAKLELIRTGKENPFYWGSFVLIGDSSPLNISCSDNSRSVLFIVLLCAASAGAIFFASLLHRRKANR
jgi:CHAT domain-containing protein